MYVAKKIRSAKARLGSPGVRNIAGNTGWLFLDKIIRMGCGVFVGVWVARYLGPERFGSLNFALAFVALFTTFTTLGLENIVLRNIVLNPDDTHEVIGTAFTLRAITSLTAPFIAIAVVHLIQPHDRLALGLVSILSIGLIFQAFDTVDSFFQSQVQSRLTVWSKNSAFLLIAGVRVYFIHIKAPVWYFAIAQVSELALGALGMLVAYQWKHGSVRQWRVRRARARALLLQSWPVILSGMAIMIYMRIDAIMLKVMVGDTAVGIYAAATRLSEVWYFFPTAIVSSVWPSITRSRENRPLYYSRLGKLFAGMTLFSYTIGAGIALLSGWLIRHFYTDAFHAAGPVLAVHVWASVFVFLGIAQAPWDFAENQLKLGFYRTVGGAVSNVLMNLVLIPRYGPMGAAIATVVSYAVSSVFGNAFSPITRPIFIMQMRSFLLLGLRSRSAVPPEMEAL